jgi:hypothetical protein
VCAILAQCYFSSLSRDAAGCPNKKLNQNAAKKQSNNKDAIASVRKLPKSQGRTPNGSIL